MMANKNKTASGDNSLFVFVLIRRFAVCYVLSANWFTIGSSNIGFRLHSCDCELKHFCADLQIYISFGNGKCAHTAHKHMPKTNKNWPSGHFSVEHSTLFCLLFPFCSSRLRFCISCDVCWWIAFTFPTSYISSLSPCTRRLHAVTRNGLRSASIYFKSKFMLKLCRRQFAITKTAKRDREMWEGAKASKRIPKNRVYVFDRKCRATNKRDQFQLVHIFFSATQKLFCAFQSIFFPQTK